MDINKVCYGCFAESAEAVCPRCGFVRGQEQPVLALPLGTILAGRYITGKVLGMGGFGVTYLGYDLTLEMKVAIKEYLPSGLAARGTDRYTMTVISSREADSYASGQERFLDEARILAKLQNLNSIVSVQNYFRENNTAYFVMDYIEGMSLKDYLQKQGGRLSYAEALRILLPVMDALSQVHALNLLHRDISPDNIYITNRGESKLLDFGAARFAIGDDKSVSVILKHGFAPEEQYRTHGNQGPWTDVYAMGATLYNCITGALPPDSIDRLHEDKLMPPSQMGIQLPPGAEAALMMALAVRPEDRFANIRAMMGALTGGASANRTAAGAPVKPVATTYATTAVQHPISAPQSGRAAENIKVKLAGLVARCKTDRRLLFGLCAGCAALLLCILLPLALKGGKKKPVSGGGGGQSVSLPASQLKPIESQSPDQPAPTEAPAPAPTTELRLEPYKNEQLAISMDVVRGYERTEDAEDSMVMFQTEGAALVVSYVPYAGAALYTLEDYEKNADAVVAALAPANKPAITTKGYTTVNGVRAYNVEFETDTVNGMMMMVEAENGFGGYFLLPAVQKGHSDYDGRLNELFTMMNSFKVTGEAETAWAMYANETLGFKFLYDTTVCKGGFKLQEETGDKVACVFAFPFEGDTQNVIEVEKTDLYGTTPEAAMASLHKTVESTFTKANGASYKLEEEFTDTDNYGYDVLFSSYSLSVPKRDYWALLATMEIEGQPFAVGIFHDEDKADPLYRGCGFDLHDAAADVIGRLHALLKGKDRRKRL